MVALPFSLVTAYRGSRLRKRKGGVWGGLPLMSVKCGEYWCVAMLNSTTYYLFLDYVVALPFFTNLTFALVCYSAYLDYILSIYGLYDRVTFALRLHTIYLWTMWWCYLIS